MSVLVINRKAKYKYSFLKTFEAGVVLHGFEVKSVKNGQVDIAEGYVRVYRSEIWLIGVHISKYAFLFDVDFDPYRDRKLLMHRKEIDTLQSQSKMNKLSIVPYKLYEVKGLIKLSIVLAEARQVRDKREDIKKRDFQRELNTTKFNFKGRL